MVRNPRFFTIPNATPSHIRTGFFQLFWIYGSGGWRSESYGSQGVDGKVGVLNVDFGGSYGRTLSFSVKWKFI
jgi:hypothetical protein